VFACDLSCRLSHTDSPKCQQIALSETRAVRRKPATHLSVPSDVAGFVSLLITRPSSLSSANLDSCDSKQRNASLALCILAKRMARKSKDDVAAKAYNHPEATRKNNPEAGNLDLVPKGRETKKTFSWDPRESPQLIWANKAGITKVEVQEQASFEVPIVNLHIHERVAPEAIVRAVRREDAQRTLFADPELEGVKELQFYQHDVDWANRMILGDSLQVMTSLLEREGMRGKVQMIYLDPPYGIKFGSNFQPRIDKRDVKDGADDDLTREVEQVQAFRDTWELGVHSYLSYLRDRLIVARELLSDSGSVFVQIGHENVHRVRCLLDEVFGENYVGTIVVNKTSGLSSEYIQSTNDYLLWYAKESGQLKFRRVHVDKESVSSFQTHYSEQDGEYARNDDSTGPQNNVESCNYTFAFQGQDYTNISGRQWKTTSVGLCRLVRANRVTTSGRTLSYKRFLHDFPVSEVTDLWSDISGSVQSRRDPKVYAVQTGAPVIARCMLMTTDPGDLVLDPTCGSGTTAYVAEQWGRRWITCDTSRVAIAIARHRLMTATFDYYRLRHPSAGVAGGFKYKTVPHITLKSIAQNAEIDAIAAEYQPQIDAALAKVNAAFQSDWQEWDAPRHELSES